MRLSFFIAAIIFSNYIFSQNMLPNGSFESATNLDYTDPVSAFLFLENWYPANYYVVNPSFTGTPDLFDDNHHWPFSEPPNFWNVIAGAAEGDFHVGIANHLTFTGHTVPEAICSPLTQPLEANEYYHIELKVRNKGTAGYLDNDPIFCVPEENKMIDVLFDTDSISVVIDDVNKNSYSTASKSVSIFSDYLASRSPGNWHRLGTCFQADGGEKFLALSPTIGRFSVNPPCIIYDEHWNAFYIYYFDIDDIKLTKLPKEINLDTIICTGRVTEINIAELAGLPIMQQEIEYHWEDGRVDSINFISEAGTYYIEAKTDCNYIPITLEVSDLKCTPAIFVPNAFSPNGDGINDYLEIFISTDLKVSEYQFTILTRWGEKVFTTNDPTKKWDGNFNGEKMENGAYAWLLEFSTDDIETGKTNHSESGDVTLLR